MSARRPPPRALERMGVLALGLVFIYAALVPFGPGGRWPSPDLVFCLVVAWVIRRPASAPLWAVLALGLAADLMLSRPVGLGALGLLAASERLRAAAPMFAGRFVLEWLAVTAAFAAVVALMQLVLLLAFAQGPSLEVSLGYVASTALAYPLVVALVAGGLRVRGPRSGSAPVRLGRLR